MTEKRAVQSNKPSYDRQFKFKGIKIKTQERYFTLTPKQLGCQAEQCRQNTSIISRKFQNAKLFSC